MFFFNNILLDAPLPNQLGFQDPATPIMEGLIDLHHSIMFYLVVVFFFVLWIMYRIILDFDSNNYAINDIESIDKKESLWFDYIKVINLTHGVTLEIIWTLIPTFILIFIAIPSFALLYSMDEVVDPELTLKVIGSQWYWSYEFSDYFDLLDEDIAFDSYMVPTEELSLGQFRLLEVDNEIVLPIQTHIRVLITASDVLHCWAVPSLAVKMDAVPGRLNQSSIFIKREGLFYGQCSELCGVNHGFMPILVIAKSIM